MKKAQTVVFSEKQGCVAGRAGGMMLALCGGAGEKKMRAK